MKEISAADAARGFSALLDAIEHDGEAFVVTRGGRAIARIQPAAGASGADVKALLGRHHADPSWSAELRAMREDTSVQERAWPT